MLVLAGEQLLAALRLRHDVARLLVEQPAFGIDVQPVFIAEKQLAAQRLFQFAQPQRDVGRHAVQLTGGGGDGFVFHHGAEKLQLAQLHLSFTFS
ncbi:Uncharacterised protein [Acinetobacter baumannii]|nr:Uncharacterised protein [Acinetobacter baumannii]